VDGVAADRGAVVRAPGWIRTSARDASGVDWRTPAGTRTAAAAPIRRGARRVRRQLTIQGRFQAPCLLPHRSSPAGECAYPTCSAAMLEGANNSRPPNPIVTSRGDTAAKRLRSSFGIALIARGRTDRPNDSHPQPRAAREGA
jgi:hypothetical protein